MPSKADIAAEIIAQATARGVGKTICPSEVSRAMTQDWRGLMPHVRAVAGDLAKEGQIIVTQKGCVVQAQTAVGPIRLGLPR
ncbi:MAG: DUF3253 domain-containing protein [Sulfitobacter sp.]